MIKVNHISKSFKDLHVLKSVSLNANAGELVHISGGNGSGKSTLFKIITGLLKQDAGTVTVPESVHIGALIENPGFLEFESALTNLTFLGNLNNRFDFDVTQKLMTQFDLDIHNKQSVSKYSVGMRQKLGIIQAVMENQTVILLDEPTRGLDAAGLKQFIVLVNELVKSNKLVIIASHDYVSELKYTQELKLVDGELLRV